MADSQAGAPAPPPTRNPLKRLYYWVLSWANRPSATYALFGIAVAESVIFPIPPDVLLAPLTIGKRSNAAWYAIVCTTGSILGAALGYLVGTVLWDATQGFWHGVFGEETFTGAKRVWDEQGWLFVFSAAFSPIPYKVFTIAAGVFRFDFAGFMIASLIGRGARFFLVAGLFYWAGPRIQPWIEKWFNWLALIFVILLIGGFWAAKVFLGGNSAS